MTEANEPCPCGSGKKFGKCRGKNAKNTCAPGSGKTSKQHCGA